MRLSTGIVKSRNPDRKKNQENSPGMNDLRSAMIWLSVFGIIGEE
jgi:hypothetical protein